mgnify:CR=1 FL=1
MIKIIIFGSLTTVALYSVGHTYYHTYHPTEISIPDEDEYREVYTRLNPAIQQMATGSLGVDNRVQWTYHLS